MKAKLSIILKSILILIIGACIGTLLLTAAFMLPVNQEMAEETFFLIDVEGVYPLANIISPQNGEYFTSFQPAVLDSATDTLMLHTALNTEDASPLWRAMNVEDYPRYWHGYVVLLRPLLHFFTYADFRILNCFLQLLLTFFIALTIWDKTKKKRYAFAFITSYALLMPLALPLSLQYSWVFYISFIGIFIAVKYTDRLLHKSNYIYFFLLLGMLTSYFDLLTYPLITWGFPIIWLLAISKDALNTSQRFQKIILSGISWICGYGGFWLLKWIIATPILKYNVIAEAFTEIFSRTGSVDEVTQHLLEAYERWEVLYINWRHYEYSFYALILIAWIVWWFFQNMRFRFTPPAKSSAYLLIIASSPVWYLTLANHTTIHHIFTYRIFSISILAFLLLIIECVPSPSDSVKRATCKERLVTLGAWGLFFITGCLLARFAKEDLWAMYAVEHNEQALQKEDTLEFSFYPTFSNIRNIAFCLVDEEGTGYYRVEVLEDNNVLYQLDTSLSNHIDSAYYIQSVNWNLTPLKEYTLRITIHENDGAYIYITPPELMPLNEYQNLDLNGVSLEGQPLGSIVYHARIISTPRIIYTGLIWMALLGTIYPFLYNNIIRRIKWKIYKKES